MDQKQQHEALKTYLLSRFHAGDWHGVSDAANDLRVLEAQMQAAGEVLTRDKLEMAVRKAEFHLRLNEAIRTGDFDRLRGVDFAKAFYNLVAEALDL